MMIAISIFSYCIWMISLRQVTTCIVYLCLKIVKEFDMKNLKAESDFQYEGTTRDKRIGISN